MIKKILSHFLLYLFVVVGGVSCASISSPEGGPIDSLPPVVLGVMPAPRTTNFAAKKILVRFNEFIQLKDQQKLFTMSPPAVSERPLLTVKGKVLEIAFQEPLDSNTTYKLDFGTSIVDNNESNKLDGFSYIFSTGAYIDSLIMAGQVVDAYTRDSVVDAFLYYFDPSADSLELDSTLFKGKVEGIFRTDSAGFFFADILKDKFYKIYAVGDKNGNQTYDMGGDYVGMLSGSFNPTQMNDFTMSYDSLTHRMSLDSLQLYFEVFKEEAIRRQNFLKGERPARQKIVLSFNAPGVVIDTLEFEGVDSSWIRREYNVARDTLTLWITPPTKMDVDSLRDTIKGRVVYERHDSVWNYYPHSQKLSLVHKLPVEVKKKKDKDKSSKSESGVKSGRRMSKCKLRRLRKAGIISETDSVGVAGLDSLVNFADSTAIDSMVMDSTAMADSLAGPKPANPFKFTVNASQSLNPDKGISFLFDYPLQSMDTTGISLIQLSKQVKKGRAKKEEAPVITEVPVKVRMEHDSLDSRLWRLIAPWKENDEYKLTINAGVFQDIGFMSNDTLRSSFTIINSEKFGTFTVKTLAGGNSKVASGDSTGLSLVADSTLFSSDSLAVSTVGTVDGGSVSAGSAGSAGSDSTRYVFELLTGLGDKAKVVVRRTGIRAGDTFQIKYVTPGEYRLRIIEDVNGNGKWDTGVLTARKPSEKARIWRHESNGSPILISKENWEVEIPTDLHKIFEGR